MMDSGVSVFVSYSHDSNEHKERALHLADRLRADGLDCEIDQYDPSPPEGWPNWMSTNIERSAFVLVICTPTYAERVSGRGALTSGKGARWEGQLITQAIYNEGGRNAKFIPVTFQAEDRAVIPTFLQGVTFYDLSENDGYERLYRRLTNQHDVEKPPVGTVKRMPALKSSLTNPSQEWGGTKAGQGQSGRLALLMLENEGPAFIPCRRVVFSERIELDLEPAGPSQEAFLQRLQKRREHVAFACGYRAESVEVLDASQEITPSGSVWKLAMRQRPDSSSALFEPSYGGVSQDAHSAESERSDRSF